MSSNKKAKVIRYALRWLPDRLYIQLNYFAHFHRLANLNHPKTYNEKVNWLKLHDHNPIYTKLVDKYEVKPIIGQVIGDEYIIPTLGVWDHFDEINFDALPEQFVLKCTHDSEGVVIVKDKNALDKREAREKLERSLKQNFYYIGREWPYKQVKPRIIAEEYMEDHTDGELRDYKFFCFDGEPKALFIATDRAIDDVKFDYFDLDFNHLDIKQKYPNAGSVRKPVTFDKMIEFAKMISKGYPHVRVDFYEVDGQLYFGEFTLYHFSGFMPFQPDKWDLIFGEWLRIESNNANNHAKGAL